MPSWVSKLCAYGYNEKNWIMQSNVLWVFYDVYVSHCSLIAANIEINPVYVGKKLYSGDKSYSIKSKLNE